MTKVTAWLIETVTQRYLHAKTLDEIVQENGLSKGTVFKIVRDWNQRIGGTAIEEIRAFTATIRKSGITIQECALGFRIAKMLEGLDIRDEFDDEKIQRSDRNNEYSKDLYTDEFADDLGIKQEENKNLGVDGNQILYFIEKIYLSCKKQEIQPSIIVSWINDLFDCYSSMENEFLSNSANKNSFSSLSNVQKAFMNKGEDHFDQGQGWDSYKKTLGGTYENSKIRKEERIEDQIEVENEENKSIREATAPTTRVTRETKDIPFVSRISYYIEELKDEIRDLKNFKKAIYRDIKEANEKEKILSAELENITNKHRNILIFFQWYSNLKQELQNKYNLTIEEEFENLAKAINDFKSYNYDINLILKDYKEIESLRQQVNIFQHTINTYSPIKENLLREVSNLNDQVGSLKQTIDTYNDLYYAGFGLKDLKQLKRTITEISIANNINLLEAVSKFLKDVEDQYDDKLGFEKKIDELKQEKERLATEVPEYQNSLRLQSLVSPALIYLNNNGVTNQDIIGMHSLVSTFANSDFLSDPVDTNTYTNPANFNFTSFKNDNYKTHTLNRNQYWQLFITKLQNLKNINQEINKQVTTVNTLKKQISNLKYNKQQLDKSYVDVAANLNNILTKIGQSFDMLKQVNETTKNKKMTPIPIIFPVLINFDQTNNKPDKKKDDDIDDR